MAEGVMSNKHDKRYKREEHNNHDAINQEDIQTMDEEEIKVQGDGDSSLNPPAGDEQVESISELIQQKEDQLRKLQEELNKKSEELDALKDLLVRRQADFENYKKRVIRLQEEDRKLAIKDVARDIININDDLLRAIDAACNIQDARNLADAHNSFVEGIRMISRQIEDMLKRYGVEEINSLGQAFDPEYNEAVEIDESPDVVKDTITKVYQKGFKLDKYVVRAARVKVTRPAKQKVKDDNANNTTEENTAASQN